MQRHFIALTQSTLKATNMDYVSPSHLDIFNGEFDAVVTRFDDVAGVVDLATLFGVEVCFVEEDAAFLACVDLVDELFVVTQGDDSGVTGFEFVVFVDAISCGVVVFGGVVGGGHAQVLELCDCMHV